MHINLQVQSIKSFQIAFAIFSLLTAILCLIVLLAPGWVNVTAQGARVDIEKQETFQYNFEVNLGLFGFACTQKDLQINGQSNPSGLTIRVEICREWAEKRIPLETVESILLIFVILFSLAALCWDLLLLFGQFPDWNKARLFLAPLATIGTLLLAITFILYWTGGCNANEGILAGWRNAKCSLGFNFFVAAAALISSFLAFITGLIIVALNRRLLRGSNYWN